MRVWLVITEEKLEPDFILANISSLTRERKILVDNIEYDNVTDLLLAIVEQRGSPLGAVYLFEGLSLGPMAKQVPFATIHTPSIVR